MKFQKIWILSAATVFVLSSGAIARAGILDSETAVVYRGEGFVSTLMDGDDVTMMEMSPSGPAFTEKDTPARIVLIVDIAKGDMAIRVQSDKTLFPKISAKNRSQKYDQQWQCSGVTVTEQTTKQYIPPREMGQAGTKALMAPVAPTVVYRAVCELVNDKRADTTERTIRLTSNVGGFVLVVQEMVQPMNKKDIPFPDYHIMSGGPLRKDLK